LQAIALWLVARPQNGVLGLALTLLFPLSPVISGLIMAHLVFASGVRTPAIQAVVAAAVLALIALIMSASVMQIVASAVTWWLPVFMLAALARSWRSMTLMLQTSVIVALLGTIGFYVVLGDPTDYWNESITVSIELARQAGLQEQADLLAESQSLIVPQMTMLFVFTAWSFYVMVVLLGYLFFQVLPGKKSTYGRFYLSFVAFAVFWLQGLAILHWLHAEKNLPLFVVMMIYALLPFLNVLLVLTFAVLGYMDAWFDFRARGRTAQA
jgi:hypothetical protein